MVGKCLTTPGNVPVTEGTVSISALTPAAITPKISPTTCGGDGSYSFTFTIGDGIAYAGTLSY